VALARGKPTPRGRRAGGKNPFSLLLKTGIAAPSEIPQRTRYTSVFTYQVNTLVATPAAFVFEKIEIAVAFALQSENPATVFPFQSNTRCVDAQGALSLSLSRSLFLGV
jgi:hypothetical protein